MSSPDAVAKSKLTLKNLVRYKWELSLGDTPLTREEFEALVALKSPLVQIRGQWVQLDPDQIEAAIRFWQKQELEADILRGRSQEQLLADLRARRTGEAAEDFGEEEVG